MWAIRYFEFSRLQCLWSYVRDVKIRKFNQRLYTELMLKLNTAGRQMGSIFQL